MTRPVRRIAAFGLVSRNAAALSGFYCAAFDCRVLATDRVAGHEFEKLMAVRGGAYRVTLALGRELIEILQFDSPGNPYPDPLSPLQNSFQHFAIVVRDMQASWQRLSLLSGWQSISTAGPERLPANTGNVTAFKFRDPEGHPLELLEFPNGNQSTYWNIESQSPFLGIDHSALSVRDVDASVKFYSSLGMHVAARTLNRGIEQQRLDGIVDPVVDVVAVQCNDTPPHLELLCYRTSNPSQYAPLQSNDLAASRLILLSDSGSNESDCALLHDPDGHLIHLETRYTPATISTHPANRQGVAG